MSWQLLLAINLIFASIREFLNKKIANKVDPFVMAFYVFLFNGILLYFIQFATTGHGPTINWTVAATGIIFVVSYVSYFFALRLSLSQTILFQSYSLVVTLALSALYLGEMKYFDPRQPAGMKVLTGTLMALISLWLLLHVEKKNEKRMERRWVVYISLTILSLGVGSFFSILFSRSMQPVEVFINQSHVIIPSLGAILYITRKKMILNKTSYTLLISNSIAAIVSVLAFFEIFYSVAVSKIYPIQQLLLVVITMIVGIAYYKEKAMLTGKRLTGVILGLGGIILLLTS